MNRQALAPACEMGYQQRETIVENQKNCLLAAE